MWLFDFHIFYSAALALRTGISPYSVEGFISPLPLAILFLPFSYLPVTLAYSIYLALNLWLLWRLSGRRGIWVLLSFPFLFMLFVGQIDFLLIGLASVSPWMIPVLITKPQVALIAFPWLVTHLRRKDWYKVLISGFAFCVLTFLMDPAWVQEYSVARPELSQYLIRASSLTYLIPISSDLRSMFSILLPAFALPMALKARERKTSFAIMQLVQPLSNIYSASVLAEWIGPREVLLSWLAACLVGGQIHSGMPMFVIALSIILNPVKSTDSAAQAYEQ